MILVENEKEKQILILLNQADGILVSKISQKINYNIGNTSKIIDRLEKEKIVSKESYAGKDMRSKKVYLDKSKVTIEIPFKRFLVDLGIIAGVIVWAVFMSLYSKNWGVLVGNILMAVAIMIKGFFDMKAKKGLIFVMKEIELKTESKPTI